MKDKISLSNNLQPLKLFCFSCHSDKHLILNCPLIHFSADKSRIIKKSLFSSPHLKRIPFKRRKFRFKALNKLLIVKQEAKLASKSLKFADQSDSQSESSSSERVNSMNDIIRFSKKRTTSFAGAKKYLLEPSEILITNERHSPKSKSNSIVSGDNSDANQLMFPERKEDLMLKPEPPLKQPKGSIMLNDSKKAILEVADFNETIENLDKMKSFKFYCVENNFDQVLKKFKRKRGVSSPTGKSSRRNRMKHMRSSKIL